MSALVFDTARQIAQRIRAREVSAVEVLRAHIAQIERINPKVNALITPTFEQAEIDAQRVDAAIANGEAVGALAGIPVAHKDLALTKGVRTTFGSPIFKDFIPEVDALIVERLKRAGAITVGKTNTPEFGAGSQTFNAVFGATRNPWDLSKTCGGSSGGAAVALACGMVPLADGSDFGGSLRNPASFCNVVGLRSSPGRVPNWPTLDAWFPLTISGPMARTVGDIALMMSAIAGPDARSPISMNESGERFNQSLERNFKGTRIAWSPRLGGLPVEPAILEVLGASVKRFEEFGCTVELADPDLHDADEIFEVLRAWQFELAYGDLLRTQRSQMKQTVIWNIEEGLRITGPQIARAERKRTELFHRMHAFFAKHDFLVCPVTQVMPFDVGTEYPTEIDGMALDSYLAWMKSCYLISATGLPALSVPAGFSDQGMPVGLQIVGRANDDFGVLQLAYAFEQVSSYFRKIAPIASAG